MMADLDKIMTALRNAHAAGDTAAAKRLAAMAKAAQGAPDKGRDPRDGMTPGERAKAAREGTLKPPSDAKLAAVRAADDVAETKMRNAPTQFGTFAANIAPGLTFGFADEIGAGIAAALSDRTYGDILSGVRGRNQEMAEAFPKTAVAGQVAGAVASPISAALVPAKGATLATNVARGAATGAAGGAIYGFGTGEGGVGARTQAALQGGLGGLLIGGAIPMVGQYAREAVEGVANSRAAKAAIAAAPSLDDLKAAASQIYAQADNVQSLPRADFATRTAGVLNDAQRSGMDDMLTPGAARVAGKMDDAAQSTNPDIGFRELDILRKQAAVPAGNVTNRTEAAIGTKMIEGIDDFIDSADPALSGALRTARDMWGQLRRSEMVEAAIERAKNAASGFENGLRVEFRKIVRNPKALRGFTAAERAAMLQVVQGTPAGNLMRQLGRIGLGLSGQSNGLGATIGGIAGTAAAGPVGGAAAVGFGTAMKALAERSTAKAAENALAVVANRGALSALPKASLPWVENALAAGGRAALPQASLPLGNVLAGR